MTEREKEYFLNLIDPQGTRHIPEVKRKQFMEAVRVYLELMEKLR